MSFSPRLVLSQSAPNLFSDWNDLERKFVSEKVKIEETFEMKKNQKIGCQKISGCQQNIDFHFSVSSATHSQKNIILR